MDIRSYIDVEVKKNEHVYHFLMPVGVPFGEAYDASFEVLTSITEMARNAAEQARPKEAGDEPAEDTASKN